MSKLRINVILTCTIALIAGSMAYQVPPEPEFPDSNSNTYVGFEPSKYFFTIGNNIMRYTSGITQDLIQNAKDGLKYLHRKLRSLTM